MLALLTNENSFRLLGKSAIELGNRQERFCLTLKYCYPFDCAIELVCLCYRADVLFISTST
jgi:hypothetical protein